MTSPKKKSGVAALLVLACVAAYSSLRGNDQAGDASLPSPVGGLLRSNNNSGHGHGRRLSAIPDVDEETLQKQIRSYLGGLSPRVDQDAVPIFLRDTLDPVTHKVLDMSDMGGQSILRDLDIVFFWAIPGSPSTMMKNIMNFCYGLRRPEQLAEEPSLEFVRDNILNVDTTTPEGLDFSLENDLVNLGAVDFIMSSYFLSASALFNDMHQGKVFAIFQHPVDHALSMFHYQRKFNKALQQVSFEDHVNSDYYMDNWMVRQLTGSMPWVELDESHLERAKSALERKIFVGIMEQMGETLRQLRAHFGWTDAQEGECTATFLRDEQQDNHPGLAGGRGGRTWNALVEKEKYDMSLYHFALQLFTEQNARYSVPTVIIDGEEVVEEVEE